MEEPFVRSVVFKREGVSSFDEYPYSIPAVRALDVRVLGPVTLLAGENGSGKSTLVEAIAVSAASTARAARAT